MVKTQAVVKTDTEENWNKAKNYIPELNTIIIYTYDDAAPKIKIGDGVHTVISLPFLVQKEVNGTTLII